MGAVSLHFRMLKQNGLSLQLKLFFIRIISPQIFFLNTNKQFSLQKKKLLNFTSNFLFCFQIVLFCIILLHIFCFALPALLHVASFHLSFLLFCIGAKQAKNRLFCFEVPQFSPRFILFSLRTHTGGAS